tara:strand:- start:3408 stop:3569 length:162 start_codon:yes stop_codon:yes gene_type:complete
MNKTKYAFQWYEAEDQHIEEFILLVYKYKTNDISKTALLKDIYKLIRRMCHYD